MEEQPPTNRRSFLKFSAVAGVGTLVSAESSAAGATEQPCSYKLSAFEALSMLSELLGQIQGESFRLLSLKSQSVADDCQDQFKKLCASVEQLTSQLRSGTDAATRAQHMKVLAEVGCSSAAGLANANPPNATALLKSLTLINEEIGLAAKALLPDGETVLSAEATSLLRDIIVQAHGTAALQRRIDNNRTSQETSRKVILDGTQNLQNLFFSAGSEILEAESGNTTKHQQARTEAISLLVQAHAALVKLLADLTALDLYVPNPKGDYFLAALEGLQQWVKDPASVGASAAVAINSRPRKPSDRNHANAQPYFAFAGFDPADITKHLKDHCPPDGAVHVMQVITAMTAVVSWKIGREAGAFLGFGSPPTPNEVLVKVRSGLNFLRVSCRPYKNQVPNPEELARQIAKIITG